MKRSIFPLLVLLSGCALLKPISEPQAPLTLPVAYREFRAAWVATVANIDWPSSPGLTTEEQQHEALAILDTAQALGLNAIVFQVRPHCDAMYASSLEPWSSYLTGVQGKAPDPYYDPLEFWVNEAHNRGIELHVWFNPYRAHLPQGGEVTDSSIVKKKPGLAKLLPNGTYWLDPGSKEVQEHSYNVVMDVVRRYDIDGVHFDDYFYPYGDGNFPDDSSWQAYTSSGGKLSREDWRRDNVNRFIKRIYDGIKKEKRYVKFGLSPFGIYRPGYPPSVSGFDQYSVLYADARLWFNEGWLDYWTPQLYWRISQVQQSFPVLLGWWSRENTHNRHLWPGMFTSTVRDDNGATEIFNQIMITRGFVPEAPGHIHFSMRSFLRDSLTLDSVLIHGPYRRQALVPASPWLDDTPPPEPLASVSPRNDTLDISWTHSVPGDVFRTVVYYKYGDGWQYTILSRNQSSLSMPLSRTREVPPNRAGEPQPPIVEQLTQVAVTAVDRTGNESGRMTLDVAQPVPAI